MKLRPLKISLLFFGMVCASCSYESEEVPDSIVNCEEITFSGNVEMIISTNCAIPGCHVPGTLRVSWQKFSNVQAFAEEIKSRTGTLDMPRGGGSLTPEEIDILACWVDAGAQDN